MILITMDLHLLVIFSIISDLNARKSRASFFFSVLSDARTADPVGDEWTSFLMRFFGKVFYAVKKELPPEGWDQFLQT